jgi:hypothetical protein
MTAAAIADGSVYQTAITATRDAETGRGQRSLRRINYSLPLVVFRGVLSERCIPHHLYSGNTSDGCRQYLKPHTKGALLSAKCHMVEAAGVALDALVAAQNEKRKEVDGLEVAHGGITTTDRSTPVGTQHHLQEPMLAVPHFQVETVPAGV